MTEFVVTYGSNGAIRVPKRIGPCTASVVFSEGYVTIVLTKDPMKLSLVVNVTGPWVKDIFPDGTTGLKARQSRQYYRSMTLTFTEQPNGSYACTIARSTDSYYAHRTCASAAKDKETS